MKVQTAVMQKLWNC